MVSELDLNYPKSFISYFDSQGKIKLYPAVQQQIEDFVKELIESRGDVNVNNIFGKPPLLMVDFHDAKIIKDLLDAGARVNIADDEGNTPLHLAISAHTKVDPCLDTIRLLLHTDIDVNKLNKHYETALCLAVVSKSKEIVLSLLDKGADVNREDCAFCPLSLAARRGDEVIFRLLLDHGANVYLQSLNGPIPLFQIDWFTDPILISAVIERISNINQYDAFGYTLLHKAAKNKNLILIQMLLRGGADTSITTTINSYTALHLVHMSAKNLRVGYDVCKLLLEYGANINARDAHNQTPLLWALEICDVKHIKLFSDYGADFTVKSFQSYSAMHFAVSNLRTEVISYVIDKVSDVNVRNDFGETALHIVAKYGNSDGCKILLDKGADIWCKNNDGHTPLLENAKAMELPLAIPATWKEQVALLLIAVTVKLQYLNFEADQNDQYLIQCQSSFKEHYDVCKSELETMKCKNVYYDLTLFDILFASNKQISGFARNEDLVAATDNLDPKFSEDLKIYYPTMLKKFRKETWKQMQIKKAQKVISDIMKLKNPLHPVCLNIASYLTKDDLEKY